MANEILTQGKESPQYGYCIVIIADMIWYLCYLRGYQKTEEQQGMRCTCMCLWTMVMSVAKGYHFPNYAPRIIHNLHTLWLIYFILFDGSDYFSVLRIN